MKTHTMKMIGILTMIFAYPVGYFFWNFFIWQVLSRSSWFNTDQYPVLIGVGILEIFLTGLSLFVIGSIRENKDEETRS